VISNDRARPLLVPGDDVRRYRQHHPLLERLQDPALCDARGPFIPNERGDIRMTLNIFPHPQSPQHASILLDEPVQSMRCHDSFLPTPASDRGVMPACCPMWVSSMSDVTKIWLAKALKTQCKSGLPRRNSKGIREGLTWMRSRTA